MPGNPLLTGHPTFRVVQLRRGNTTDNNGLLGAQGEATVDLDKKTLVIHDGVQVGGFPLQRANVTEVRYLTFRAALVQQGIASLGFSTPENAPSAVATQYGDIIVGTAGFDQYLNQSVQDFIEMPNQWRSPVGLDVIWKTTATVGTVEWKIETCSAPIGSLFGDGAFINPILMPSLAQASDQHLMVSIDDIGATYFSGNGKIFFRLSRVDNDTLNATAHLLALQFRIPVINN